SKNDAPPSIWYLAGIDKLPGNAIPYADYENEWNKLFDGQSSRLSETSISIIHVYNFIREVGAARKPGDDGGIRELHFLSHSWRGGPILVNTLDLSEVLRNNEFRRDPFDKDGRAHKDFIETNYTREQLDQFRAAFSKDAFAFLWGCDATFFWKELIRQTMK